MDYRLEVIDRASQLPCADHSYEALKFDMKTEPSKKKYERAKDIAAFANASGGHILVGAIEINSSGKLYGYKLLKDKDANEEKKHMSVKIEISALQYL